MEFLGFWWEVSVGHTGYRVQGHWVLGQMKGPSDYSFLLAGLPTSSDS